LSEQRTQNFSLGTSLSEEKAKTKLKAIEEFEIEFST
jgi:hypothetical protein